MRFAWYRLFAIIYKEFIQMRRDKATFAMMIGVPVMQLTLFGFAINTNPQHLPSVIIDGDQTSITRQFISAMENTHYFAFLPGSHTSDEANSMLKRGEIQFAVTIPAHFSRDLIRGEKPALLVQADATDPVANGRAVGTLDPLIQSSMSEVLRGPLADLNPTAPPFEIRTHAQYNPLAITQYNIVPGLLGVVLTMTMVIITALAITRETERGTMENLLATPTQPLEIMIGKIIPYILVGYTQVCVILFCAHFIFHIPIAGNIGLLLLLCLPFIAANLSMGLTFSTLASNQLQAMQSAMFFFLPSLLLSGFMFPFRGMPMWAQYLGSALPLSHFLLIVRGLILKGNGIRELWPQLWPIMVFTLVVITLGLRRFRATLD